MHIHVLSEKGEAKFWLEPNVELAQSYRLGPHELNEIRAIIFENEELLKDAWCRHFGC